MGWLPEFTVLLFFCFSVCSKFNHNFKNISNLAQLGLTFLFLEKACICVNFIKTDDFFKKGNKRQWNMVEVFQIKEGYWDMTTNHYIWP